MSKDSLKEAFKGSYAVFGVTNFWETASKETELKQGHNIADAAKEAGVEVFIWSSLPNVTASEHSVALFSNLNEQLPFLQIRKGASLIRA